MDKEKLAIQRIKMASKLSLQHYGLPLEVEYSGGKDSDVLVELFRRSGEPFEVAHSLTTVDAPETVRHIYENFKLWEAEGIKCIVDKHEYVENGKKKRITMWNLIPKKKMPPTRIARYCCAVLKETRGGQRFVATGVRKAESRQRAVRDAYEIVGASKKDAVRISDEMMLNNDNNEKRRMIERCEMKGKMVVNPIIDWTDKELWEFIETEKIEVCELYKNGFFRCGCIGCPMASKGRWRGFRLYPTYKRAYIRAFDKMLTEIRKAHPYDFKVFTKWVSAEEVFNWWMEDDNIPGQMSIEDFI